MLGAGSEKPVSDMGSPTEGGAAGGRVGAGWSGAGAVGGAGADFLRVKNEKTMISRKTKNGRIVRV